MRNAIHELRAMPVAIRQAALLSYGVSLTGALGMIGWMFDFPELTTVLPDVVSMKFGTCSALFFQGISTAAIVSTAGRPNYEGDKYIFPCCMMTLVVMVMSFAGVLPFEEEDALHTVNAAPSLLTAAAFFLLVAIDLSYMLRFRFWRWLISYGSCAIFISTEVVLLGHYLAHQTGLEVFNYFIFYVPNVSTGQAIPTAVGLGTLAIAHLITVEHNKHKQS